MNERQLGFTIIEVVLFFAISTMLLVVALRTMSGTIASARFQDGVKTTESFITAQYSRVQANSVTRPVLSTNESVTCPISGALNITATGGTNNQGDSNSCSLLGEVLKFNDNNVEVYAVLGNSNIGTSGGTLGALAQARPRVFTRATPAPTETWLMPWGMTKKSMKTIRLGPAGDDFDSIAILRSPGSEAINLYFYNFTDDLALQVSNDEQGISDRRNTASLICLQSPDTDTLRGAIKFTSDNNSTNYSVSSIEGKGVTPDQVLLSQNGVILQCL